MANVPYVLQFAMQPKYIINNSIKGWLLGHIQRS